MTERSALYEMDRGLMALRYEVSQAVADDVGKRVRAAIAEVRAEVRAQVAEELSDALTRGMHLTHDDEHWISFEYLLDVRDKIREGA